VRPEFLEHLRPVVNGFQSFAVDPVEALPAVAPHGHESHLLQHAKVLRYHRLRPTEPADDDQPIVPTYLTNERFFQLFLLAPWKGTHRPRRAEEDVVAELHGVKSFS